jgi:hypothetical protein
MRKLENNPKINLVFEKTLVGHNKRFIARSPCDDRLWLTEHFGLKLWGGG